MNTPLADVESFRLAYWLRHPEEWSRVIGTLAERSDRAAVEGLIELLQEPPSAQAALAAMEALETCDATPVHDALYQALKSPHVFVRQAAIRSLHRRKAFAFSPVVSRMLGRDPSWLIRRCAVEFLASDESELRWDILKAGTDPHWRVRHALIGVLLNWTDTKAEHSEIVARLTAAGTDARTRGVLKYLDYRQTGQPPEPLDVKTEDPAKWCEFWDWDPAVLAWRLEQMPPAERREKIALMPRLIGHEDERVRRWAAVPLLRDGDVPVLLETLRWLDDPRHSAYETVLKLAERLDGDRKEQLAQTIFVLDHPSPGQWVWAIEQIGESVDVEDVFHFDEICERASRETPLVRAALARMLSRADRADLLARLLKDSHSDVVLSALDAIAERSEKEPPFVKLSEEDGQRFLTWNDPEIRAATTRAVLHHEAAKTFLPRMAEDSFSEVRRRVAEWLVKQDAFLQQEWQPRLQQDENSLVRAAALTVSRAEELLRQPQSETSWRVLEQAARQCKTPIWKIAPEPLPKESVAVSSNLIPLSLKPQTEFATRRLADRQVSPLGLSGHYGLPVEGFGKAMEAGINLMFWEPNYHTLTSFMGRLPHRERNGLHMVVGTFEAAPERIRKDVEKALQKLQAEQIAVFLLFWTRSWYRITDPVRGMLDQLKRSGKIGNYGLSTHSRPLAVEAIEAGWNPVMVRHSVAHRGAETVIFPKALEHGTGLLTFNNTCYGRILEAFPEGGGLSAADCYRYTLSFDAVTACWSAPGTMDELAINLDALISPELPSNRRELLCEIGRKVYEEDTTFRQLVRGV